MNLKLYKPDYKYNRENYLDYNRFGEYIKKYNNKQVVFAGFNCGNASLSAKSNYKNCEEKLNSFEHNFEMSLIIKRYNNILSKKHLEHKKSNYLSFTSFHKNKSTISNKAKENNSNNNSFNQSKSNSSLMITQMPNKMNYANSMNDNDQRLRMSVIRNKNNYKNWSISMSIPSSLNNSIKRKSEVNKRRTKAYSTINREKYDQGPFFNEENSESNPYHILKELKSRYNFCCNQESEFEKTKNKVFEYKGTLSAQLLPKYSVRHVKIMKRKNSTNAK